MIMAKNYNGSILHIQMISLEPFFSPHCASNNITKDGAWNKILIKFRY